MSVAVLSSGQACSTPQPAVLSLLSSGCTSAGCMGRWQQQRCATRLQRCRGSCWHVTPSLPSWAGALAPDKHDLELAGPYACQLLQGLQAARGPGPSEPPANSISISPGCMHVHIWSSHSIAQWLC